MRGEAKKEIEELKNIIRGIAIERSYELLSYEDYAIAVYLDGYRRADVVRKETAKEIISKLTDDLSCIEYPPERQLIKSYIEIFMKQYDLEAHE